MSVDERRQLEDDKKLKKDYVTVTENIRDLLFSGRNNGEILNPNYIRPKVDFRRDLPFDSVEGELWYFFNLRTVLERAIKGQLIPADSVPCQNLPKYISDLVR